MNESIIKNFQLLAEDAKEKLIDAQLDNDAKEINKQTFRLSSLKKTISAIKKLNFEIKSSKDLKDISGIGKGSLDRIQEILDTGKLSEIVTRKNRKDLHSSMMDLETVIGIGSQTAKEYVKDYGITSVEELKKAIKNGTIEVNDKIKLGLKYHGVIKTNIPRAEIKKTEKYLLRMAEKVDDKLELVICGSYRRGKPTSNDIDVLIYHPNIKLIKHTRDPKFYKLPSYLEKFVNLLKREKFIIDDLTDKNYVSKYMGFCKYDDNPVRRIDIRLVPYKSVPTALLYFTGPFELNTYMRQIAKKKKMLLNEYGLYNVTKKGQVFIPLKTEKDVFKHLGMEYLTPQEREQFSLGKKSDKI